MGSVRPRAFGRRPSRNCRAAGSPENLVADGARALSPTALLTSREDGGEEDGQFQRNCKISCCRLNSGYGTESGQPVALFLITASRYVLSIIITENDPIGNIGSKYLGGQEGT